MTIVLNDDDIGAVLNMADCVKVLEQGFRDQVSGSTFCAPRRDSFMEAKQTPGAYYSFKTIEGGLERFGVVAQRINSDLITNPEIGGVVRRVKVPSAPGNRYVGLIFLYSSETTELLAIMQDGHLQRTRVAGTSGVGAKFLSRPDSSVLALMGSGWQAETAAWAMAAVRPLKIIRVYSPNPEHCKDFCQKVAAKLGIEVLPAKTPQEAIKGADIVASATNAMEPVVKGAWLEPGMHLTQIISTEFDEAAWQKSDLIVIEGPLMEQGGYYTYSTETLKQSPTSKSVARFAETRATAGEWFKKYRSKVHFLPELLRAEIPGRTNDKQITFFDKNIGLGIEFATVAKLVYDQARARGIGKEIPTEWFSQTSHP